MGFGGFAGEFQSQEVVATQDQQNVKSFPMLPLRKRRHGAEAAPVVVDQLENIRLSKSLEQENKRLVSKRLQRVAALRRLYERDALRLKGVEEIEAVEAQLRLVNMDSLDGQKLQYQKSMLAFYYGMPVEYIQADSASANIEGINYAIKTLARVIAQLPADDESLGEQAARIGELKAIKTGLYKDMEAADRVFLARRSVIEMIYGVARLVLGGRSHRS
ncbi:MAG: hypothetical protein IPK79_08840 [Vampirovibrionales bacterium]|nr:hypothetical protein [Vampirovibrionales bacterium]